MNRGKYLFLVFPLVFSFCDPSGIKEFYVFNSLSYPISVRIIFPGPSPKTQTDTIPNGSTKMIYSQSEMGIGAIQKISGKEIGLYFDTLQCYHHDSIIYCQCPTNADFWQDSMVNTYEKLTLNVDSALVNK